MQEEQIQQLRKDWLKANKVERVIIEAKAREMKTKTAKVHVCKASLNSHRVGNYYVFICSCTKELGRDLRG